MDLKQLAKNNDQKAVEVVTHIYAWMVGMELMEQIAHDSIRIGKLGYEPKQSLKRMNNRFNKAATDFNKALRKELGNDQSAEGFGDTAEFLHELFNIAMYIPAEARIKLLSTAKILIRDGKNNK